MVHLRQRHLGLISVSLINIIWSNYVIASEAVALGYGMDEDDNLVTWRDDGHGTDENTVYQDIHASRAIRILFLQRKFLSDTEKATQIA